MKIAVISPMVPKNIKDLIDVNDYVIYACDGAVKDLIEQNIRIDLAIGDFDSLKDFSLLKNLKTIKLNKEKDYSDTNYAINHAYKHSDKVFLIGGIKGSRVDHFLANLLLLDKFKNLVMIDDTNKLFILEKGIHHIYKNNYQYLTVIPVVDTLVSIEGTKYNLKLKHLKAKDQLGLSNEIISDKANITVKKGRLLIIQSK